MLFNTSLFFGFFCLFFILHSFVFTRPHTRALFMVAASLIFYAGWDYRFVPLLVFSGVVDFFVAQQIEGHTEQRRRKQWLFVSLFVNLGILGIFKYSNFMIDSVQETLSFFGVPVSLGTLEVVLPVGISFYTFQSMSYTIDVYRRETKARHNFVPFFATLSFFPQLVAGPILRAKQILPQIERFPDVTPENVKFGFVLITMGLFKKTIADLLSSPAQTLFNSDAPLSWIETVTGVLAFAGQIYGDFSGYSDIAIGIALLLGIQIPLNFNTPYFALSPVDFWKRWHISLSSWLRDYLYISLGGNRNGRQIRNVFITMLLGGLWHGAAWTFVIWGAYHGVIISATHMLRGTALGQWLAGIKLRAFRWLQWLFTFYLVCIGWVFFRAESVQDALTIIAALHSPGSAVEAQPFAGGLLAMVAVAILLIHCIDYGIVHGRELITRRYARFVPLLILGLTFTILIGEPGYEFIYFQF
ncbi:membrane-bound O-acyltransferase family protein [Ketobacter alkanivorans]|uniref:Probable alginate O-acetylase n=2 Tax=Ketobacter alkanivorans TaxID=1917421 RepID=A0A2K9LJV0_9GAMM|nr:membrane-bound O-acyltransferase family protein [Ketobacter alkanivorans]MCP5015456.1 MBOAT family protein [Ketobacter sp.]